MAGRAGGGGRGTPADLPADQALPGNQGMA